MSDKAKREKLVEKLLHKAFASCHERKVGAIVERLTGEDAEIVKTLTCEDFNHRI